MGSSFIINMKPKTDLEPDDKPLIKSECTYPDHVADYDRIKLEAKLEPGIEINSTADSVDQMKIEFQRSEKLEEKLLLNSTNFENVDALGLHEEFDIKTESEQCDSHDLMSYSAQIEECWKREQKYSHIEEEKESFSCYICNYLCYSEKELNDHIKENHSASNLSGHMLKHTNSKTFDQYICKHCNKSFKVKLSLFDHILKKHPNFSGTVPSKIHECMHCAFKTTGRNIIKRHMVTHDTHKHFECTNCEASFKTKLCLDDHILRKHAEFTDSVSHKIHKCAECEYKTTFPDSLARHIMKHTGTKLMCTKCDASFTTKLRLDNHVLKEHPGFTASVSSKIHECIHCEYKTTYGRDLAGHMMKHTGTEHTCTRCDATFTKKLSLENHILQKHPELAASVSSKIHECTRCEYKTTYKNYLAVHMMKHTGAKLTCTKCDAPFIKKITLDDHILQKHPEMIASVSRKIYECTRCEYKSTEARHLARHLMKHTGAKLSCTKCDATFILQRSLEHHVLRKHPEFTSSVSSKLHECTQCEYKTIHAPYLANHIIKHTGSKLTCTKCDASFASKQSLHNHILQKHPELAASVSSKIHECTQCEYKTTFTQYITRHKANHMRK
ncbi:unnamed protein product [Acanthoscelides obtectus]|uniref:C2H2-type domain-containing protein n=1 Tax=Acanthoscelides obtectus TaxID=200917 RepID=A0A9P0KZG1_ACAOB|nr:unnamed protein product [Acanthoscelides obtectus]CAK1676182.1 Zinc finger protein 84 [Acanthoscelides obtectus]